MNEQLEQKLDERLALAGIEVVEARINYLAYAPEIAAVMLRRQQASAIITAREKIVEGAVSQGRPPISHSAQTYGPGRTMTYIPFCWANRQNAATSLFSEKSNCPSRCSWIFQNT